MGKKILRTLTNNLGFKILALIFAFVMWLLVCNIDDPVKTKTFTCSVTLENADALADMNKYYEITNGTSVTFVATAEISTLEKLSDYDFKAVADMSRILISEDMTAATIPIEITCSRYSNSVKINAKNRYMTLALEDLQTNRFMINADTKGTVAEGYALGEITISAPNVIQVSGPASVVSRISRVAATINVDGMSVDIQDNVIPELYDADENIIDTTKLTLSIDLIAINAKILSTKEVPVYFSTSGTPEEPYSVVDITSEPQSVWIKGSSAILNPITSITVPEEVLNVEGAAADIVTTIDVSEYLPAGVELMDKAAAMVSVAVKVEAYRTREYSISTGQITMNGELTDLRAAFAQNTAAVRISGMESALDQLSADMITGSISLEGLREGTHSVPVTLNLDSDLYTQEDVWVDVILSKEPEEEEGGDSPEGEGSTEHNSESTAGNSENVGNNGNTESSSEGGTNGNTESSGARGSSGVIT